MIEESRHDDYVKKKEKERKESELAWETKQIFSQVENSDKSIKILPYFERFTHSQIQLCKLTSLEVFLH